MTNRKLILIAALLLATVMGAARAQSNDQAQATASQDANSTAAKAAHNGGSANAAGAAGQSNAAKSAATATPDRAGQTVNGAVSQKANMAEQSQVRGTGSAIRPGTRIPAELQSTLDARKAKPRDQVVAKVNKDVKQDGRVVVHKGDRLIGHVDSVQARGNGNADSKVAVSFDRLVTRSSVVPLNAVVTAVLSAAAEDGFNTMGSGPAMDGPAMGSPAPRNSGGGGLLGGVGSSVGSTVSGTLGAAGNAVDGVAGTAGSVEGQASGRTAGALSPLRGIAITSTSQASGRGSASTTLTSPNRNLHIEKGTRMEFEVAGSSSESAQVQR